MEIPPSSTGRLIGPAGRQINEIQAGRSAPWAPGEETSGAKIDLDKGRDPCVVRMTGTADAVALAQVMIREAPRASCVGCGSVGRVSAQTFPRMPYLHIV